eukprot:scaffold114259_cov31-Tisochrysis_lutea.AAC.3
MGQRSAHRWTAYFHDSTWRPSDRLRNRSSLAQVPGDALEPADVRRTDVPPALGPTLRCLGYISLPGILRVERHATRGRSTTLDKAANPLQHDGAIRYWTLDIGLRYKREGALGQPARTKPISTR